MCIHAGLDEGAPREIFDIGHREDDDAFDLLARGHRTQAAAEFLVEESRRARIGQPLVMNNQDGYDVAPAPPPPPRNP
jgi:hypothetical protein